VRGVSCPWRHRKFITLRTSLESVPVAARSKAKVCGRPRREIVGSNPAGGMNVCMLWVLCVLSGRGLCDELITRLEELYRLWSVVVCDLETSRMGRPWPTGGCRAKKANKHTSLEKHMFFTGEFRLEVRIHYIHTTVLHYINDWYYFTFLNNINNPVYVYVIYSYVDASSNSKVPRVDLEDFRRTLTFLRLMPTIAVVPRGTLIVYNHYSIQCVVLELSRCFIINTNYLHLFVSNPLKRSLLQTF